MRNYYDALDLQSSASSQDVREALDALSPEQLADEDDIESILLHKQWQMHYQRMHLQYTAISAAIHTSSLSGASNAHQWDKRTVEFDQE